MNRYDLIFKFMHVMSGDFQGGIVKTSGGQFYSISKGTVSN